MNALELHDGTTNEYTLFAPICSIGVNGVLVTIIQHDSGLVTVDVTTIQGQPLNTFTVQGESRTDV